MDRASWVVIFLFFSPDPYLLDQKWTVFPKLLR
jgi:hypothetical protein